MAQRNPARYALPSPCFASRCSTWTLASAAASPSARRPVPSGELSSITSTSRRSSWASTRGTIFGRLIASLYVGISTRARSGTAPPGEQRGRDDEAHQAQDRDDADQPAAGVGVGPEHELDAPCAGRQRDRDQAPVAPQG